MDLKHQPYKPRKYNRLLEIEQELGTAAQYDWK